MTSSGGLFKVAQAIRAHTDTILVGVSGGKDSAVTLDICCKLFPNVTGYFYYLVPGLSFQEDYLDRAAKRYGITIHRMPHWCLTGILRESGYRPHSAAMDKVPNISATEMENIMRKKWNKDWIVTGERAAESLHRRGMLKACGGLDAKRRRGYPLSFWPIEAVRRYIKTNHVELSQESTILGRSFGNFRSEVMIAIKDHFPDDFAKIKRMFPHVEAAIYREKFFPKPPRAARKLKVPKVRDAQRSAAGLEGSGLQPSDD